MRPQRICSWLIMNEKSWNLDNEWDSRRLIETSHEHRTQDLAKNSVILKISRRYYPNKSATTQKHWIVSPLHSSLALPSAALSQVAKNNKRTNLLNYGTTKVFLGEEMMMVKIRQTCLAGHGKTTWNIDFTRVISINFIAIILTNCVRSAFSVT